MLVYVSKKEVLYVTLTWEEKKLSKSDIQKIAVVEHAKKKKK